MVETHHDRVSVPARFASASVNKTSHFIGQEIRRGLLCSQKRDESQGVRGLSSGKTPRQSECRSHAAAIIVRAGRTKHVSGT